MFETTNDGNSIDVMYGAGEPTDETTPQWGENAPRGAKVVLGRIIKDGANVPMFLAQTLINSLRDTGYNNTTSAICEHVDNSVEAGATEIRVYFIEAGPKGKRTFHVLVLDNGKGMSRNVMKAGCAFGGSMRFDSREAIGRFGMGLKAAALSVSSSFDLYSWQEPGAYYGITIDVDAIGQDKSNVIYVPEPQLHDTLPAEVTLALNTPMVYPKNPGESQTLFCRDAAELREKLGPSGTIVFMPDCDRLTHRKVSTLVDHAIREMSRVYRRQLHKDVRLYINNRRVEAFDPMYQMADARHTRVPELAGLEQNSRLVNRWQVDVPVAEGSDVTSPATVRLYFLPIAVWSGLPRKVLKDLRVFDYGGISFVRGDREVDLKAIDAIVGRRGTRDSWWRIEVDFTGTLDEAFGVAMTKQGVRPKSYVQEIIKRVVLDDLREVRRQVERHWSEQAARDEQAKVTAAEQRANESEALQSTTLPKPPAGTPQEQQQLDANLRLLAVGLKRDGEDDEQAFTRVKGSTFVTTYKHDDDAAFYRIDFKLGKVILTLNTAHAFYERLYKPLSRVSKRVAETSRTADGGDADSETFDASVVEECSEVLISLQLFLLSLGRTQSEMMVADTSGDLQKVFDKLRRQWSLNLETQLTVG